MRTNKEGLTYAEWRAAAGLPEAAKRERSDLPPRDERGHARAWIFGEDPTKWRAAQNAPVSKVNEELRREALGDMVDALQRLAHSGALDTMAAKRAGFTLTSGLHMLALQAGLSDVADAVVDLQKSEGL